MVPRKTPLAFTAMGPRRERDGGDGGGNKRSRDSEEPRPSRDPPSIGEQTSGIKNKVARSEMYAKLKHKQKVGTCVACLHGAHASLHTSWLGGQRDGAWVTKNDGRTW